MNDNILNIIKRALRHVAVLIKSPSLHLYVLAITIVSYMMIYVGNEICDLMLAKVNHVINAIVLVSPFFLFKPKVQKCVWSVIVLIGIWSLIQIMYIRTYHDIMPLSSFFMIENISWLLIDSAIGNFRMSDMYILVPLLLSYICYRLFILRRLIYGENKCLWKVSLSLALVSISIFFLLIYKDWRIVIKENQLESGYNQYVEFIVNRLTKQTFVCGFLPDIIYQTSLNLNLNDNQLESVNDFIKNKSHVEINNARKDKNLILIIVESFNSWAVNFTIDGKPVTPNISKMVECDSSITALKIVPQVCHGRSSDGHFIYNTGILPVKEGVVSVNFGSTDYPSIAKALNYINSVNIICDEITFWNQDRTTTSYGFDRLYGIDEIRDSLNVEDGITDELMFNFASKKLPKLKQPFFAQLVTLNMHQPYNRLKVSPTWISDSEEYTENVRNYLEAVHFFDAQLGNFIYSLKKNGLYDNSVIVIASDHNETCINVESSNDNECVSIPLVILNADTTLHYNHIMGQIDVFPTILDIMGVQDYYWRGVGNSILREPKVCSAVTKFGDVVGDANSELVQEQHKAWEVSDLIIRSRYFDKNNSVLK